MTRPMFVYDADCGFCTRSARWLQGAGGGRYEVVPWQQLDLDDLGLTVGQVTSCAYWLEGERPVAAGADAIGSALLLTRWRWVGRIIRSRKVRPVARWAYGNVARNRHRLPGGAGTCQHPPDQ